ncbi:cation:proton antiporter [Rhizobium rhizosphaerae]|uniref:Cation:proton antiporter n=1 Tax=Xaviernesmea rhizosphaerae TaxID=1672749 RepID=A0A1Q9APQ2_9HYPH|nr:monovalent cation/H(+) antiporter subunit G [Xaviernesmea rhizosphaerae]OLP57351.1 cation:proton antiporter [Xaviernesmea rhizosphaerae]OQP84754.1 cation:proton antiporter [Xaviernesmea rhizosphaerae]
MTVLDLPAWAAIPVCLLLLLGAGNALAGAIGLLRLKSFYARLHAPSLMVSGATILICLASMLTFAVLQNRWVFHELAIIAFMIITTPVTLMLLGQAALYRDRAEGSQEVPHKEEGLKTEAAVEE